MLVRLNTFISLKILLILNPPSPSHCKIFSNYSVTLARNKNVGCKYTIILTNERIRTFLFSVDCVTSE